MTPLLLTSNLILRSADFVIDTPAKEGILDIFCCNSLLWKYNYNASSLYNHKKGLWVD